MKSSPNVFLFVIIAASLVSSGWAQLSFGKDWHPNGKKRAEEVVPSNGCLESPQQSGGQPDEANLLRAATVHVSC